MTVVRTITRGVLLAFVGVFCYLPLAALLWRAPTGFAPLAAEAGYYLRVVSFTVGQALGSTLLALLAGLPCAYVFARLQFVGRRAALAIVTLPFVLPTVVVAAALLALVRLAGGTPDGGLGLVLVAHTLYNYGVVARVVGAGWAGIDPQLSAAAALLGAGGWRGFVRVVWPLLRPAIIAAALLVFSYTLTSFGIIVLLGDLRQPTVEVEIYRQTAQLLRVDVAAALALLQLVTTGAATLIAGRLAAAPGSSRRPARRTPRGREWLLLTLVALLALATCMPLAAMLIRSLQDASGGWSLAAYTGLAENARGAALFVAPTRALATSGLIALAASGAALALGLVGASWLAHAQRGGALEIALTLPLGISAVTLGLGALVAFAPLGWLAQPWLLVALHALLALPLVVRALLPAVTSIGTRLREAAAMLGAGPLRVWWRIDLPLLAPALRAAGALAAALSLGEYGVAALLARPETTTAPLAIVRLLALPGAANYARAMALATLLALITALLALAIDADGG